MSSSSPVPETAETVTSMSCELPAARSALFPTRIVFALPVGNGRGFGWEMSVTIRQTSAASASDRAAWPCMRPTHRATRVLSSSSPLCLCLPSSPNQRHVCGLHPQVLRALDPPALDPPGRDPFAHADHTRHPPSRTSSSAIAIA